MQFKVIDCPPESNEERWPLRVTTLGYNYKIVDRHGDDIIRWHWHPRGQGQNPHPHIHARPDLNQHFSMPRVTLEQVIRACIEHGVNLTVDIAEAHNMLATSETAHVLYRSWSDWPPGRDKPYPTSNYIPDADA